MTTNTMNYDCSVHGAAPDPNCVTCRRIGRERAIAEKLVSAILARGYVISIHDGEEFTVKQSPDAETILKALATTDMDTLVIREPVPEGRKPPVGRKIGTFLLIWGNDEDLISDASSPSGDDEAEQIINDLCDETNALTT